MDHRLMLGWAQRNLDALKLSDAAFRSKNKYSLVGDKDDETGEHLVRVAIEPKVPIPDEWPYQIGDIIHNMRVAIDYSAFAVAMKYNPAIATQKAAASKVAFPICQYATDWPSFKPKLLKWASIEAVAAFESVQPYQRPHLANLDPLLLLHKLDNPHKHRNLLSAAPAVTAINYDATGDPDGVFGFTALGVEGPFVNGAVVARCKWTPTRVRPHRKAKVETQVVFEIAFDEQGPAAMYPAIALLDEIADLIRDVVFPAIERQF